MPLLSSLWPYLAMAVMGLGIFGLWEEHKADKLLHAQDQAVIKQHLKDEASSAKQIGILETKLGNLDTKVQPIIQHIVSAPTTTSCGPTVGYAADSVRELLSGNSQPPRPLPVVKTGVPKAPHP